MFAQRPWLAVKRLQLFSSDVYPTVFTADTTAAHVMFAHLVRSRVEMAKGLFPATYRTAWQLTALVAVFLVGRLLRADEALACSLADPRAALEESSTTEAVDVLVKHVVAALRVRQDSFAESEEHDDFKVEFKNEAKLRDLAKSARERYVYYRTVGD